MLIKVSKEKEANVLIQKLPHYQFVYYHISVSYNIINISPADYDTLIQIFPTVVVNVDPLQEQNMIENDPLHSAQNDTHFSCMESTKASVWPHC